MMTPGTRVIVAQAPLGPRGSRAPLLPERGVALPVGVLPSPTHTTIVTRLTFGYPREAGLQLAALVRDDRPLSDDDLVVFKPQADVVLTGSVYAAGAVDEIGAGVQIGSLGHRFVVAGSSPRESMPLTGTGPVKGRVATDEALRAYWERDAEMAPPRFDEVPDLELRDATLSEQELDVMSRRWLELVEPAPMIGDEGPSVAVEALRTSWLRGDESIGMDGLVPGGGQSRVRLPGLRPLGIAEVAWQDLLLVFWCDTVVIDTEAGHIATTWRAHLPIFNNPAELRRIVLSVEAMAPRPLGQLLRELPHGVFHRAVERGDDRAVGAACADDPELRAARLSTWTLTPRPLLSPAELTALAAEVRGKTGMMRREILERHHLDEDDWMLEQRCWARRAG